LRAALKQFREPLFRASRRRQGLSFGSDALRESGRSKMSMSSPASIGGFEEGKFEGDSPTEEVAAQIRLHGADPV